MITQTVTVESNKTENIIIGRRGTYGSEIIAFDMSWLIEVYGDGTAILMVKRPTDTTAYPAVTTRDGNTLNWEVNDADTSYKGHGECELFWYVDDALAKTVIWSITILRDIGETTETPPDPYQTWVDYLTELGEETLQNAQDAAESASDAAAAQTAAETAQGKAETAQGKAEQAQGKAEQAQGLAEGARDAAITAKDAAETAVTHYPKIVNAYWYVWSNGQWVNTGVKAEGVDGREIVSISAAKTSTSGLVDTYTVTVTYNQGNNDTYTFTVTNGEDGYNPVVTIQTITGGHRVTITDKTHPTGQTVDIMDGEDGITPTVTVTAITGGHNVAFSYGAGDPRNTDFDVMDGEVSLADLTAVVNAKADVITDTAEGTIISIPDGADDAPIKSLTANFSPVQDLHGYANPWPAGGGVNKCPDWENVSTGDVTLSNNRGVITLNGTASANIFFDVSANLGAGTYYLRAFNTALSSPNEILIYVLRDGESAQSISLLTANNGKSFAVATGITGFRIRVSNGTALTNYSLSVMLVEGSTAPPTFAPYSNECPISGWTGANIYDTGSNLWDEEWEVGGYSTSTGGTWGTTDRIRSKSTNYIPVHANTTYYVKCPTGTYLNICFYDADKVFISSGGNTGNTTVTSPANAVYARFATSASYGTTYHNDISINYPSTDTEYHAYNPASWKVSVTWQDEAGTVYGGYLIIYEDGSVDLIPAVETHVFDGTEDFLASDSLLSRCANWECPTAKVTGSGLSTTTSGLRCSHFAPSSSIVTPSTNRANKVMGFRFSDTAPIYLGFGFSAEVGGTVEDFKTYLATQHTNGTPVMLSYEIKNPQTIHLDPVTAMTTLLGTNNIWTSLNGTASLGYRCDTKKYIDKKIAAVVAALS